MNILIATDKFKDSLSAEDVCKALKKGILKTFPVANCELLPLADGGEGTLLILAKNLGGEFIYCSVNDPLFRIISAAYLWIESSKMAIVEMARASGFELLKSEERNCLETSTFGTGELIKNAIQKGAKKIILTAGGSATNDAGIGMATALGYKFYDINNNLLKPIGKNLINIHRIEKPNFIFQSIDFQVITDVSNPLYGENGAAYIFAPQKGADKNAVELLDNGLKNIATIFEKEFNKTVQNAGGSGAGGGIGGGAMAFLNANISSATDWILEVCEVAKKLQKTDFLITGEGRIDSQTWQGKLIARLNKLAEKNHVPVILVCGTLQDVQTIAEQENIMYATSILDSPMSLENALKNATQLLENEGILLGKLLKTIKI